MNFNYYNTNNSFNQHEREWNEPSHSIAVRKQSYALFNRVMVKGYVRRFFAGLLRKSQELFSLSNLLQNSAPQNAMEIGLRSIPLQLVVGSENRCKDFDNQFTPFSERNHQRWLRISDMFIMGETIPAVDLIQVGQFYFVRDGHHRISVARALEKKFIDAKVTVFQLSERSLQPNDSFAHQLHLQTVEF
ncbi:MAG: hypothetical protein IH585_04335 [Anaerolineaceae bacterium]|nr:hypothetical protein [Anaerolineaceae bacterium]